MARKGQKYRAIPWTEIRGRYLAVPELSLRRLAAEFKLENTIVQRRAARDGWATERASMLAEAAAQARQKVVSTLAETASKHAVALLDELRGATSVVLRKTAADLAGGNAADVEEEVEVKVGKGREVRITRRRAHHAGHSGRVIIQAEIELLSRLLGRGTPTAQEDRTVAIG